MVWATRVLALAVLALPLAGCGLSKATQQLEAEKKDNADLRSLNDTLSQQLTSAREEIDRLENELVKKRLGGPPAAPSNPSARPTPKAAHPPGHLDGKRSGLAQALAGSGASVAARGDSLVITAPVAFESGMATLTPKGTELVARIGTAIVQHCPGWEIGVAGHSDSTAITKASTRGRFPTNWHLSGFRALAAMECLIERCHINPTRLHFRGYGQYHPIANNTSAEGRARNRRLEFFLDPPH